MLPSSFILAVPAPCCCQNQGQHLWWWVGRSQSDVALSQRSELLLPGHMATCRRVSVPDGKAGRVLSQMDECLLLVWQMSNGSNYITGRGEPSCTLLWSREVIAKLLCSTRSSVTLAALQHCNTSHTYPFHGHSNICHCLCLPVHHLKRDRRRKKPQSHNCTESVSFTQLMQRAMNCSKGLYSLFVDFSAAIHKGAWKNNSSWLHVLMHLCSCNHSVLARL